MVALARLQLTTHPRLPPTPLSSAHPLKIQSMILQAVKIFIQKTSSIEVAGRNSYKMIAI